jgi:type I restriction-modification system DNA methylase subunit
VVKKKYMTQQQLEKYLWGAATLLRGTIDAGDYKQYILPLLFFKRICDYLAFPDGDVYISDNAPGCNSSEEVEDACETVGVEKIMIESVFTITPNPASNKIKVTSNNELEIATIAIYNQLG